LLRGPDIPDPDGGISGRNGLPCRSWFSSAAPRASRWAGPPTRSVTRCVARASA